MSIIANPTVLVGPSSVPALEMFDGFRKGVGPSGPWVAKKYLIDWLDSDAFANGAMGICSVAGGLSGTIFRQSPHACPESPNLRAQSVDIEGEGRPLANGARPTWKYAVASVQYGVLPYSLGGGDNATDPGNLQTPDQQAYPFCSFALDGASEVLTLPETSYKFAAGQTPAAPNVGKALGYPTGVRIGTATLVVTVHRVPFFPAKVLDLMGSVSNATFLGRPAGTILFDAPRTLREIDTDGTVTQELTLFFKYRAKPWNYAIDPTNGSFYRVTANGLVGGSTPYPEADLRPLLYGVSLN